MTTGLATKVRSLLRMVATARRLYGISAFSAFVRFIALYRRKFSPVEMAQLELLNTRRRHVSVDDFVSNERLLEIQAALNPVSLHDETEDKNRFYRRCAELGFPVPDAAAEISTAPESGAIVGHEGEDFLARVCADLEPGGYVLKPAKGYHGDGVLMLRAEHGAAARTALAEEMARHLERFSGFDSWLIQKRLRNHADVLALSPSNALQTIRIVTCVELDGKIRVIAVQWRLAQRDACIDNFNSAARGLLCNIVPETGVIETCWRQKSDYPREFGFEVHHSHPDTGLPLVGRKVPFWNEAVDLASRAATAFLPARAIGWDVAISERGIVLIEGNRLWDPHNEDARMGERVRYLTAQIAAGIDIAPLSHSTGGTPVMQGSNHAEQN